MSDEAIDRHRCSFCYTLDGNGVRTTATTHLQMCISKNYLDQENIIFQMCKLSSVTIVSTLSLLENS